MNGESERHVALLRWEAEEVVMSRGIWETSRHWKRQRSDSPAVFHSVQQQPSQRHLLETPDPDWTLSKGRAEGIGSSQLSDSHTLGPGKGDWGEGQPNPGWTGPTKNSWSLLLNPQPQWWCTSQSRDRALHPLWDSMSSLNSDPQAQGHDVLQVRRQVWR